jgi:hypothetical protein
MFCLSCQELHEQLEDVDHPKGGEGGSKEDNKCSSPSPSKEDKSGVSPSKESNKSSSSPSKTVTAADKPGASPSKTVTAAVDRNAATPASTTSVLLPAAAAPMLGPLTELQVSGYDALYVPLWTFVPAELLCL